MKTKKVSKMQMFNSLIKVMDGNKKIWSSVKEITKAYKSFLDGTNKLNLLKDEYEKDLNNLIDRKAFARKSLIIEALPISNVIVAFAIENNKKKLVKKCNYSKAELRKAKDLELLEYSKSIWKEAKKLYSNSVATPDNTKKNQKGNEINIHNYGLTGQMIDKLEIANVTLVETRLELMDAYGYKKQCKKKITAGIDKNISLLKNKLDLLITIFKASDPGFYEAFVAARTIKKVNIISKPKSEKPKSGKKSDIVKGSSHQEENVEVKKVIVETKTPPIITEQVKKPLRKPVSSKPVITKVEGVTPMVKKPAARRPAVRKPPVKKTVTTKPDTTIKTSENKEDTVETNK